MNVRTQVIQVRLGPNIESDEVVDLIVDLINHLGVMIS